MLNLEEKKKNEETKQIEQNSESKGQIQIDLYHEKEKLIKYTYYDLLNILFSEILLPNLGIKSQHFSFDENTSLC